MVFISFQIWMDEDLKMLSDPCNGVTYNKESYASEIILQGTTNKVNSWHLRISRAMQCKAFNV